MWAQILLALPSLAINCKLHHDVRVLMKRHGENHFSHICTKHTYFPNLWRHMENKRILRTNLIANSTLKNVTVITLTHHMHGRSRNLGSHVRTYGFQVCIHLYSSQQGLHELWHVSLANQQSRQIWQFAYCHMQAALATQANRMHMHDSPYAAGFAHDMFFGGNTYAKWWVGTFAGNVTHKLPCHVLGRAHGVFFISKTFAKWRVASCLFHATQKYKQKTLRSKSVSACAGQKNRCAAYMEFACGQRNQESCKQKYPARKKMRKRRRYQRSRPVCPEVVGGSILLNYKKAWLIDCRWWPPSCKLVYSLTNYRYIIHKS